MGARRVLALAAIAAAISLLTLTACSATPDGAADTAGSGAPAAPPLRAGGDVTGPSRKASKPTGPAIAVTWEALAREKYLLENSRFRRRGAPQPPQKITLLSESHPDAKLVRGGRSPRDREELQNTAVLPDADMRAFLKGLDRQGFFRLARPGGYDTSLTESENARGRVTVTRNGVSHSLLSLRGQGLNERTKQIPRIYSETKQAIMVLRNMNPTLNVTRYGVSGTARTR